MTRSALAWIEVGLVLGLSLVAPTFLGGALSAQSRGLAGLSHSCMDCHLRRHDERTAVSSEDMVLPEPPPIGLPTFSFDISNGSTATSAECLECHSSAERRRIRGEERPMDPLPIAEGLFLGVSLSDDHPLGNERRGSLWRTETLPSDVTGLSPQVANTRERLVREEESLECSDCHDPHSPFGSLNDPSTARTVCLQCHDPGFYGFQGHITPSCTDCHAMHGASGDRLLRTRRSNELCTSCHEGGAFFGELRVDAALHGPPGHDDFGRSRCTECHRVHAPPGS